MLKKQYQGKVWKFSNNVSTDAIAPGRLLHLRSKPEEYAKHVLEDADPAFASNMNPGDFVVGGRNFGLGSSREHAPTIIKLAGVSAVIAVSFARIFYRNAINVGLPVIQCDSSRIGAGDELEVDLAAGTVRNITDDVTMTFPPLPGIMRTILEDGGLVQHIKKHGDFTMNL